MDRQAERVCTDQASVKELESLIDQLPTHGHMVLVMKNGSSCDGVVSKRPNVQVFRDAHEREGINAVCSCGDPTGRSGAGTYGSIRLYASNIWICAW
jgi:Protein of unknown function (DUF3247)